MKTTFLIKIFKIIVEKVKTFSQGTLDQYPIKVL